MLEIKPICENCSKLLPNESSEAMICSFECTFCAECVNSILLNVCPNCGGGFERRPTRPQALLTKYPISTNKVTKLLDSNEFKIKLTKYKNIQPNYR
jgi:uncharacterized protein